MDRHGVCAAKGLEVERAFRQSRLSAAVMGSAYERLMPVHEGKLTADRQTTWPRMGLEGWRWTANV